MRKVLFILLLTAGVTSAFAQAFQVKYNGEILTDGQEVVINSYTDQDGELTMKFDVEVINISGRTLNMWLRKQEVVQVMENTENDLCWDLCMDITDTQADCSDFEDGTTQNPYARIYLNYNGGDAKEGTSIIKYRFGTTKVSDPKLNVTVNYVYKKGTGVFNEENRLQQFNISQLGDNKQFQITASTSSDSNRVVEIIDISGRVLQTISLPNVENASVTTDQLLQGCYLLRLKDNKQVLSVKKGFIR